MFDLAKLMYILNNHIKCQKIVNKNKLKIRPKVQNLNIPGFGKVTMKLDYHQACLPTLSDSSHQIHQQILTIHPQWSLH
ncbi:hypothetical protein Hanom_Chr00s014406g01752711 [Helianthus anomalus]